MSCATVEVAPSAGAAPPPGTHIKTDSDDRLDLALGFPSSTRTQTYHMSPEQAKGDRVKPDGRIARGGARYERPARQCRVSA